MEMREETSKEKEVLAREHIKEAGEAGKRVRFVLGIIVTASILAFASFWNSLPYSWKKQRLHSIESLSTYLNLNLMKKKEAEKLQNQIGMQDDKERIMEIIKNVSGNSLLLLKWEQKNDEKISFSNLIKKNVKNVDNLEKLGKALDEKIIKWSQDFNTTTYRDDWDNLIKEIEETIDKFNGFKTDQGKKNFSKNVIKRMTEAQNQNRKKLENAINYYKPIALGKAGIDNLLRKYTEFDIENVKTIRVPFFNINFDINDLGFIGGFSFCILMIILYYSLKREYLNLIIVYEFITKNISEKEHRCSLFYLLSMNQLLSMTSLPFKNIDDTASSRGKKIVKYRRAIIRHIPKGFYFMPLFLLIIIVINDFLTFNTGLQISTRNTLIGTVGACLYTLILIICTILCLQATSDVDGLWNNIKRDIENKSGEASAESKPD